MPKLVHHSRTQFVIVELNCQSERAVQVIQCALRIAALPFDFGDVDQCLGIIGFAAQHLQKVIASGVVRACALVELGQRKLDGRVLRRGFGQIFVVLDRSLPIVRD